MRAFRHVFNQPFIVATGLAALVHSTWALGTLFAGQQPEGWHLLGWLAPALLIAFALDVGQIATSAEIREHGLTLGRGATFFIFAAATYYLQWLYIAHHMPALEIAAGVSATARATAVGMRDAAVWIIPAFLPLSTVLYTFSGKNVSHSQAAPEIEIHPEQMNPSIPKPVEITAIQAPAEEEAPKLPFGSTAPEPDESPSPERTANMEAMPNGKEPTVSANGRKKPSTRRIQNKK